MSTLTECEQSGRSDDKLALHDCRVRGKSHTGNKGPSEKHSLLAARRHSEAYGARVQRSRLAIPTDMFEVKILMATKPHGRRNDSHVAKRDEVDGRV